MDCEELDVLGFLEAGDSFSGFIVHSAQQRQFSAGTPIVVRPWALTAPGRLVIDGGVEVASRCAGDRLDYGVATYQRYSADLSTALNGAAATRQFEGVKY